MLTGYHLAQKVKGLGYTVLHSKVRRDFARDIIGRSKLFQNTDPKKWAAAYQARVNDAQMTIASYPQDSTIHVKSFTKHDLMQNGLMKKSFIVTDNFLIGVLLHPGLEGLGPAENAGRLRKRNFISHWFFGKSKWRYVLPAKVPALDKQSAAGIAAILNFLNHVPIVETELADGMFCFTHKHLEHHADIPKLATELKLLAETLSAGTRTSPK